MSECPEAHLTGEKNYECLYCAEPTAQAPIIVQWKAPWQKTLPDRIYPSCCLRCAKNGLWHCADPSELPKDIVAIARALPPCPIVDKTVKSLNDGHACSAKAAMVQWAYDVITEHRGFPKE
jgi:hypothetical protein